MAKKNPEVRFKKFAKDWEEIKFNDTFIFSTGRNIKQQEASPEFKTPCVRYGELYHMYGEVITEVINRTNIDESELLFSKGDEILLPSAGEDPLDIGSASALITKDVAIGRTINILRPKHREIHSNIFVSYYINQNLRREISSLAKGVSISNVYNSDLKTLKAKLPSIDEQKQIGKFFQNLDTLITQHQKKYDKLVVLKEAMLDKMFPENGALVPEIRFKGCTEDWKEQKLSYFTYKAVDNRGKTPPLNKNGNHSLIEVDALGNGAPDYSKISKFLDDYSFNNFLRDHIRKGDILFSTVGSIGLVSLMDGNKNAAIAQNIVAFRAKEGFLPEYLYALFSNNNNKSLANKIAMRGIQPSIKVSQLVNVKYYITTNKDEQWKIGEYFQNLDKQIDLHQIQLEKLNNIKKACFTKMFVAQD